MKQVVCQDEALARELFTKMRIDFGIGIAFFVGMVFRKEFAAFIFLALCTPHPVDASSTCLKRLSSLSLAVLLLGPSSFQAIDHEAEFPVATPLHFSNDRAPNFSKNLDEVSLDSKSLINQLYLYNGSKACGPACIMAVLMNSEMSQLGPSARRFENDSENARLRWAHRISTYWAYETDGWKRGSDEKTLEDVWKLGFDSSLRADASVRKLGIEYYKFELRQQVTYESLQKEIQSGRPVLASIQTEFDRHLVLITGIQKRWSNQAASFDIKYFDPAFGEMREDRLSFDLSLFHKDIREGAKRTLRDLILLSFPKGSALH